MTALLLAKAGEGRRALQSMVMLSSRTIEAGRDQLNNSHIVVLDDAAPSTPGQPSCRSTARVASEGGEQAIRDRLRASVEKIAAVAPQIRAVKAELEETLSLYRDLLTAQDQVAGSTVRPPRSSRVRARLTFDEVVDADPGSLLALTPLQPGPNAILPLSPDDERRVVEAEHNRRIAEEAERRRHLESVGIPVDSSVGMNVQEDSVGAFGNQPRLVRQTVPRLPPGRV